jgi:hypothetical protein
MAGSHAASAIAGVAFGFAISAGAAAPARSSQGEPPPAGRPPPASARSIAAAAPATAAQAATIRLLATTAGPFAAFSEPSAAADGAVAFRADQDGGGHALCVSTGGAPRVIVRTGDTVEAGGRSGTLATIGGRPGLQSGLEVAFTATFSEGGRAVLVARDGGTRFDLVADGGEAFRRFGEQAALDRNGRVLFHAELDPPGHPDRTGSRATAEERAAADALAPPRRMTATGRRAAHAGGLFLDHGRWLETVVATGETWLDVADGAALGDDGAVVFLASRRVGEWGMWRSDGAAPQRLLSTGDGIAHLGVPALSSGGMAACSVALDGGGTALLRLRSGTVPPEWLFGREAGFAELLDQVAIDAAGRVAFVARGGDAGDRLFLTAAAGIAGGAPPRQLLSAGAAVDGRTVAGIRLSSAAFIRSDRLALHLVFADGGEAVALCHFRSAN